MPVRVLQIAVNMGHNGIDHLLMEIYRHIDRERYQFDFIAHGSAQSPFEEEVKAAGGRIFYIPTMTRNYFASQRDLLKIIEAQRYPIVHSHQDSMTGWSLRMAKKAGVPIRIAHAHNTNRPDGLRRKVYEIAARSIPANANYFLGCTQASNEFLFGSTIAASERCQVLKNAIETKRFHFSQAVREKTRRELGLTDELTIINVGRLAYSKNHEYLLNIFAALCEQHPRSVLLLAGRGELEEALRKQAEALGISACVRFLGARADIPELLQAADLMVMPSRFEGLPLAGIEAQTSGLPVLFADTIDPISRFAPSSEFISLEASPLEWAQKIISAYERYPRRADQVSLAVENHFDISGQAASLADYYDQLLKLEQVKV